MTITLPPWLGPGVLFLVCASAFLEGGEEERLTAGGLLLNVGATVALRDYSWPQVQRAGFAVDIALLCLLVGIALRSPKAWPMAASSCQLLVVLTHVAKMIDGRIEQWAYITAIVIWTYLLMIALGVGVWKCWRDESNERPWRAAGRRSRVTGESALSASKGSAVD